MPGPSHTFSICLLTQKTEVICRSDVIQIFCSSSWFYDTASHRERSWIPCGIVQQAPVQAFRFWNDRTNPTWHECSMRSRMDLRRAHALGAYLMEPMRAHQVSRSRWIGFTSRLVMLAWSDNSFRKRLIESHSNLSQEEDSLHTKCIYEVKKIPLWIFYFDFLKIDYG